MFGRCEFGGVDRGDLRPEVGGRTAKHRVSRVQWYADFVLEAGGSPEQFIGPAPPDYFQQGKWDFARVSDLGRLEHIW